MTLGKAMLFANGAEQLVHRIPDMLDEAIRHAQEGNWSLADERLAAALGCARDAAERIELVGRMFARLQNISLSEKE